MVFLIIGERSILALFDSGIRAHARRPACPRRIARRRARPAPPAYSRVLEARLSFAAIGRAEGLSRERVRQIVAKALDERGAGTKLDHARVQIARLEPALQLAAGAVAEGDLAAIDRLLRVLDRLDRYSAVEGAADSYHEGGRARLLAKLNTMAERMIASRKPGLVDADGGSRQDAG